MAHKPPQDEASGDLIQQPELAHIREEVESGPSGQETDSDDELEATELHPLNHNIRNQFPRLSHVLSPGQPLLHWYDPVKRFWRHEVRISVPHEDCRDHLANERTFLGYLRTSLGLSMIGTLAAQVLRLYHRPHPSKIFGYFVLSIPLAEIFQCAALCCVVLGCIRFWRQQRAMALGKVHAGGWEVMAVALGSFMLLLMVFVIDVAIDIYKIEGGD